MDKERAAPTKAQPRIYHTDCQPKQRCMFKYNHFPATELPVKIVWFTIKPENQKTRITDNFGENSDNFGENSDNFGETHFVTAIKSSSYNTSKHANNI